MADPQLNVQIGAHIEGLLSGLKHAEGAIKDLAAPIREVNRAFSEIGEATGITYAINKISELVDQMGELGEHAVNMGLALGTSAEAFQTLTESMSLVGASGDSLTRALRMLSRSAETAMTDMRSHQADAFKAMQVDVHQFADMLQKDPIKALEDLADAAVRTGQATTQGALGWVLGRGGTNADLFAWFSRGAAGIREMQNEVKALGAPSGTALQNLAKMEEAVHSLGVAFTNLKVAIADAAHGPLTDFIKMLRDNVVTLQDWTKYLGGAGGVTPGPGAQNYEQFMRLRAIGATPYEAALLSEIGQLESRGNYRALQGGGETQEVGGYPVSIGTQRGAGMYQFQLPTWQDMARITGEQTFLPRSQDINALMLLRTRGPSQWTTGAQAIANLAARGAGGTAAGTAGGVSQMDLGATDVTADAMQKTTMVNSAELRKQLDETLKTLDEKYQAQVKYIEFEKQAAKDDHDVVIALEQQKKDLTVEYFNARAAEIQKVAVQSEAAAQGEKNSVVPIIEAQKELLTTTQHYHQDAVQGEIELLNARIKGLNAAEQEDLKQVERRRRLNQITTTDAAQQEEAIVRLYEELVAEILTEEEKKATGIHSIEQRIAADQIQQAQDATQKIVDFWDKANQERAKAAQDINKTIAQDFSSTFMSLVTGRETLTQAFAQLGEKLGQTLVDKLMQKFLDSSLFGAGGFGGLLSSLPFIGALFRGGGGSVPSAAGGWVIPQFQGGGILSVLHGGEMVLPRDISEGMQGMIRGGGGGGAVINIHAMDTQTGAQFLMRNAGSVGQAALRYSNVSPRAVSSGGARFP